MKNQRILITGAAGSIGSELVRQLCKHNKIYGLDINESDLFLLANELNFPSRVGDIRDEATVKDVFDDFRPHIIFHCAALKHVSPLEYAPLEAIKTNILGTYNIIHYSKIYEAEKMINISTDKVINARSIMGISKKFSEVMVQNSGFISVRFANVLGSRGSLVPIWQNQLDNNKKLTVTDKEMFRYMMTLEEAVELVITASEIGKGGEIFVLDMKKRINVLELAKKIVSEDKIEIIGVRPGETFDEKLMTFEEEKSAKKIDKFWILYANER